MAVNRFKSRRTEAVVLRRADMGESDRLLTLFTRDFGKLKAISKGSRKPSSRQTGHVELFGRSAFLIADGKTFDIVTQAESIEMYVGLRDDLVRSIYAGHAAELVDRFTEEEDKNINLFYLLTEALGWFANEDKHLLAARFFELRLLSLTGFQPQLFHCVASGEPIEEEDQYFSAEMGGLLKPEHLAAERRARPISASAAKVLRFLQTRPWDQVRSLNLRRDLHQELEDLLHHYITFYLERRLQTADFLRRLRYENQ